jgi:hypothetical protein
MTLPLRKQRAQDRIEGRGPGNWADDDCAVVDQTLGFYLGRYITQTAYAGSAGVFSKTQAAAIRYLNLVPSGMAISSLSVITLATPFKHSARSTCGVISSGTGL